MALWVILINQDGRYLLPKNTYDKKTSRHVYSTHTEALKSILRFLSTLVNIELSIASVGRKLKYIFSSTN